MTILRLLSLISLLTKILQIDIGSCEEIFNAILNTINSAINMPLKIPVPGLLLSFSDMLPGYSADRAYMNITERLEAVGVNLGPIYGSENKLNSVIKGIIDGHTEEMDTNSYVKIALKPAVIASTAVGAYLTPLNVGVGKIF